MTRLGRHYFEHAIIYKQIFKVGKQATAPILFSLSICWVGEPVRCALFFFFLFFIQYDYIFFLRVNYFYITCSYHNLVHRLLIITLI